jgi:hypothetical protein
MFPYLYRVRICSIILAAYITLLAFYPCSDEIGHAHDHEVAHAITDHTDHDHSEDGHTEPEQCSPLCVCGCCATQVKFPTFDAIRYSTMRVYQFTSTPYLVSPPLSQSYRIWQPPKCA